MPYFGLNAFPPTPAVCAPLSPKTIITGNTIDHNQHCILKFGEYVHTHEHHTNDLQPWTIEATALWPAGNDLGGY
eukprot:15352730-Ditylum_brightwellii.AAC.1